MNYADRRFKLVGMVLTGNPAKRKGIGSNEGTG